MSRTTQLTLVLAESALETIPKEIWSEHSVEAFSKKIGKPPGRQLLDKSYHFSAMAKLKNKDKRGRPDIIHFSLLEALGSPLNLERQLRVFVHTINDFVISFSPAVRLPRNYSRFLGLMEQLFETGRLPDDGEGLLGLHRGTVHKILRETHCTYVVALSRTGSPSTPEHLASTLMTQRNPAVLVGGFPKGTLSSLTLRTATECVSLDPAPLDAWIAISRVLSAVEQKLRIPQQRFARLSRSKYLLEETRDDDI